jgi:hypothetical protein
VCQELRVAMPRLILTLMQTLVLVLVLVAKSQQHFPSPVLCLSECAKNEQY